VFADIDWASDLTFIQIELDETGGTNYQMMGLSQLLSVPYALYAEKSGVSDSSIWKINGNDIYYKQGNVGIGLNAPTSKLVVKSDSTANIDDVIFSVLNAQGDTVLAVYQEGVRIWVADDTSSAKATGNRGGFAVGGFNPSKATTNEYLRVTPDSVRVYIEEDYGSKASGNRGGFAVGGFSPSKSFTNDYLFVNDDSTRVWTTDTVKGFGVKNIGINTKLSYMQLTPNNYFIGHEAGKSITTGLYNSFIGYQSGYNNLVGDKNYFIGYRSGFYNSSGCRNIFIGDSAGFSNSSGIKNVYIGNQSGLNNIIGNFSVFIGYSAGFHSLNGNNVFIGCQAGYYNSSGNFNVANGWMALYSNTIGVKNVAVGGRALFSNTTGNYNSAIGLEALFSNTTGSYNTANGSLALKNNISASYNTATGDESLYLNTTGACNTANGAESLRSNIVGSYNTAHGDQSLYSNSSGNSNTATGTSSLWSNTTGDNNTAIGNGAMSSNTIGYNNTALGYSALSFNVSYYNSMALGYSSQISGDNMVRVGNASVGSIGGFADWTNVSDIRFKKDIHETVPGLAFITKLRPVTYYLDMDKIAEFNKTPDSLRLKESEAIKGNMLQTGFIAQEVESAANEIGFDFSGVDKPKNADDYYGLRYAEFTVPLVKAVQELNAKNEQLLKENEELKALAKQLIERIEKIEYKLK
ncbi:MAG: tail fiber domain-containing protein, partial [Bacteroidota bacterium]